MKVSRFEDELLQSYALGERDFRGVDLQHADLSHANLEGSDFSNALLCGAKLDGANLDSANLFGADLMGASLTRAVLSFANLARANLRNADLTGATLTGISGDATDFSGALLIRASLEAADLIGAIFVGANLTGAIVESADLEGADLTDANLTSANLHWAKMSWANLTNARLNWARVTWANLEAADLEGANLTGTDLQASRLSCANLSGALIANAILHFTDITGTRLDPGLVPPHVATSCRLSAQTYTRSQWSPHILRQWQQAGATILHFDHFPADAQQAIATNPKALHLEIEGHLDALDRVAIEWLLPAWLGPDTSAHLTLQREHPDHTALTFCGTSAELEHLAQALHQRVWRKSPSQLHPVPIPAITTLQEGPISRLDRLAARVRNMDILLPAPEDDEVIRINEELQRTAPEVESLITESSENLTRVSWSSVQLPRLSPDLLSTVDEDDAEEDRVSDVTTPS